MIAVCGAGEADTDLTTLAHEVGYSLARAGAIVVSGGLGGVMAATCAGAKRGGGTTVGIVPGADASVANAHVDVAIASGMAQGRNVVIIHSADAVVALPGAYGTLSEISLALNMGKAVVTLGDWCPIGGVEAVDTVEEGVQRALTYARQYREGTLTT